MTNRLLDTASQRPATGLNQGVRELILRVVAEVADVGPVDLVDALCTDRYGSLRDYYEAVEGVWGSDARYACASAMSSPYAGGSGVISRGERTRAHCYSLLLAMPEPDFRVAIEESVRTATHTEALGTRITKICQARGAPWSFTVRDGFQWVGEELVEEELLRPALSMLDDQRFAGGVRAEFQAARDELKHGTPVARKQAVAEAGCAVESAMKVVLDEHRIAYDAQRDAAQALFEHLLSASLVPRHMERIVLGAVLPRNRRGAHGAGSIAHDVSLGEAEATVASAAGAIAYLGGLLPPQHSSVTLGARQPVSSNR